LDSHDTHLKSLGTSGAFFQSCVSAGTEPGGKCGVGRLVTTRFAEVARFAQPPLVAASPGERALAAR